MTTMTPASPRDRELLTILLDRYNIPRSVNKKGQVLVPERYEALLRLNTNNK